MNPKMSLCVLFDIFELIQMLATSFRSEINPLPTQQCNFIAFNLPKNSRFIPDTAKERLTSISDHPSSNLISSKNRVFLKIVRASNRNRCDFSALDTFHFFFSKYLTLLKVKDNARPPFSFEVCSLMMTFIIVRDIFPLKAKKHISKARQIFLFQAMIIFPLKARNIFPL